MSLALLVVLALRAGTSCIRSRRDLLRPAGGEPAESPVRSANPRRAQAAIPGHARPRDRQPHALACQSVEVLRIRRASADCRRAAVDRSQRAWVPASDARTSDGAYPRDLRWVIAGDADGIRYQNDAILMVAGGSAPSPFARTFDPYHLPRIQATAQELASWLTYFDHHPDRRYVSDGDPKTITIPRGTRADLRPGAATRAIERP